MTCPSTVARAATGEDAGLVLGLDRGELPQHGREVERDVHRVERHLVAGVPQQAGDVVDAVGVAVGARGAGARVDRIGARRRRSPGTRPGARGRPRASRTPAASDTCCCCGCRTRRLVARPRLRTPPGRAALPPGAPQWRRGPPVRTAPPRAVGRASTLALILPAMFRLLFRSGVPVGSSSPIRCDVAMALDVTSGTSPPLQDTNGARAATLRGAPKLREPDTPVLESTHPHSPNFVRDPCG